MWMLISPVSVTMRWYLDQLSHAIYSREVDMHLTIFFGCLNSSPVVTHWFQSPTSRIIIQISLQYGSTYNSSFPFFLPSRQFQDLRNVPAAINPSWFLEFMFFRAASVPWIVYDSWVLSDWAAQAFFSLILRQTAFRRTLLMGNRPLFAFVAAG